MSRSGQANGLRVGSLFSGCLGLDLGLEAAGWNLEWACESDLACQRTIERRRPGLLCVGDVRDVGGDLPEVDLLAGGFPCQDLSYAGLRAGLEGARSGLWSEFDRAIRLLRPRLVLVENVPGLTTRGIWRVVYDLAEAGYVGSWIRLRASDVGAPHKRERIFILAAHSNGAGRREVPGSAYADEGELAGGAEEDHHLTLRPSPRGLQAALTPDPGSKRFHGSGVGDAEGAAEEGDGRTLIARRGEAFADTDSAGREAWTSERSRSGSEPTHIVGDAGTDWGQYRAAVERWESILGVPAPRPTDDRGRLAPEFAEWMMGFPIGWTHGESRTARLRMIGNAVHVQCAEYVGVMLRELDERSL